MLLRDNDVGWTINDIQNWMDNQNYYYYNVLLLIYLCHRYWMPAFLLSTTGYQEQTIV